MDTIRRAGVFSLLVGTMMAADAPPPEDPILAAKRGFDTLKAAPGDIETARLMLPGLATPQLRIESGEAAPFPSPATAKAATPEELAAARKSENWLVDAMMGEAADGRGRDLRDPRAQGSGSMLANGAGRAAREIRDAETGAGAARNGASPSASTEGDANRAAGGDTSAPGRGRNRIGADATAAGGGTNANPLDRYMASWMSSQDYTLLRSTFAADASSSGPGAAGAAGSAFAGGLSSGLKLPGDLAGSGASVAGGSPLDAFGLAGGSSRGPGDTAPVNPYLAGLAAPASAPPPVLPNVAPAAGSPAPPSALTPPAPAPDAAKNTVPDFAKPRDDDKYFKQLKRF